MKIDFTVPEYAYLLGLLQTDGHYYTQSRNRGRITLEASIKDVGVAEKLANFIPVTSRITYRVRKTNFSEEHTSFVWSIYDREFREALNLPPGRKSGLISPPDSPYSIYDYWRGVVDGDGSLGFTSVGIPFVSITTASKPLKEAFLDFLEPLLSYRKIVNRNRRDKVFNIGVTNEHAVELVKSLYYPGCIALNRKFSKAQQIAQWVRVGRAGKRGVPWEQWELDIITTKDLKTSLSLLPHRTEKSIKMKLYRMSG